MILWTPPREELERLNPMSRKQLKRYALDAVDRLEDDPRLDEWLPDVVRGHETYDVGVFRCVSGEIHCAEGMCNDDCGCCGNDELWESPLVPGWGPECGECGRKALLV